MKISFKDFVREVYLRSTPSVDLDLVPDGELVDCTEHTIPCRVWDGMLAEYCEDPDERFQCNMFLLQSGPQLIDA